MLKLGTIWNFSQAVYCRCRVHWYNPGTQKLDVCAAKSLHVNGAATHPHGWEGWRDEALHDVAILHQVGGVPGVVAFRDLIIAPAGAIHIIMEWVPLCSPILQNGPMYPASYLSTSLLLVCTCQFVYRLLLGQLNMLRYYL